MCGWGPYAREASVWEACCWYSGVINMFLNCLTGGEKAVPEVRELELPPKLAELGVQAEKVGDRAPDSPTCECGWWFKI